MKTDKKQPRGQATRTEIIEVTRQLFSEHGYYSTGIADIQEATGLTKGAFYHHFRTKEDLALAVLEAAKEDYARHLIEPAMKADSPGGQIAAMLDGVADLNCQPEWRNCLMMATLSAEMSASDGRLRDAVNEMQTGFFETWRDLIDRARKAGEVSDAVSPEVWAQLIINNMAGALVSKKIGCTTVGIEEVVGFIKKILIRSN